MSRWAWLKLVVAAIILALVVRHVDLGAALARVRNADARWIAVAWLAAFATYGLRAMVLCLVAVKASTLTPWHALRVNLIGSFFAAVVPSAAANDVVRGWYLVPHFPSIRHAVAAVVVQRLLGLVALALLVGAALMSVRPLWGAAAWAGMTAGAAVAVVVLRQSASRRGRIAAALRTVAPSAGRLAAAFAFAFCSIVVSIGVYAMVARALDLDLPATTIFLASSLAILGVFTPLTPAGLGMSEGAFVATVAYLGGDADAAFAVSVVVRGVLISISLVGGALFLRTRRRVG